MQSWWKEETFFKNIKHTSNLKKKKDVKYFCIYHTKNYWNTVKCNCSCFSQKGFQKKCFRYCTHKSIFHPWNILVLCIYAKICIFDFHFFISMSMKTMPHPNKYCKLRLRHYLRHQIKKVKKTLIYLINKSYTHSLWSHFALFSWQRILHT